MKTGIDLINIFHQETFTLYETKILDLDQDNEEDAMFVSLVVIRFGHSLAVSSRGFGGI